ncbi:unnamed protein product, partial [Scytosiphon promiscuus]
MPPSPPALLPALPPTHRNGQRDREKKNRITRMHNPQGFNDRASCIRHTLDEEVPFSHRPLALYAILGLGRAFVRVLLNLVGFRRGTAPCGKFMYWHRRQQRQQLAVPSSTPAASATPGSGGDVVDGYGPGPIVFFHGVGTGL